MNSRLLHASQTIALLFTSAFASADAQQTPKRPAGTQGFAIVVGVSEYSEQSGLAKLRYAAKDATEVSIALEASGYQVRTLLNENATRSLVRKAVRDLKVSAASSDQVLFYFSGHGFQDGDRNVLATYGVAAEDIGSDGLPVNELIAELDGMNAASTAVMIDACRSQSRLNSKAGTAPTFSTLTAGRRTEALYSTQANEASFEDERGQQGVFTKHLIEGLRGGAADPSGKISFDALARYVQGSVKRATFSTGKSQTPTYVAPPNAPSFVLSTRPAGAVSSPPNIPPPAVPEASPRLTVIRFGADRFAVRYDPRHWDQVGEAASDRIEFSMRDFRMNGILSHENVQSGIDRLITQSIEALGGATAVRIVANDRERSGFHRLVLEKAANRYVYLLSSGVAGTLRAVVYGPTAEAAWSNGLAEALLRGIEPVRSR